MSKARKKKDEQPAAPEGPTMIVVAVRGMALFPGVVLPIAVARERSVRAVQAAVRAQQRIGVLLQRDNQTEEPGPDDLYTVGTAAEIARYITAPDETHHLIVQGQQRFRVLSFVQTEPYLVARVELIEEQGDPEAPDTTVEARFLTLKQQAHDVLELLPEKPEDLDAAISNARSPSMLTDMVATFIDLPAEEKQDLLETIDLTARMQKVSDKLAHLIQVLSLSNEMRQRTAGKMDRAQREYLLREQLKTIQKELGEGHSVELQELARRIGDARMPEEVEREARKELARLESMPEASAEHGMVRTYLDWLVDLPWSRASEEALDLERARRVLDEDHFGLEKVKRRILEFLAVRKLNPNGKSPILCLVGPPGVGKTSLGQSIARAMGREFVRISLGGVHDEAEIRGHRRTYVGAMPGRIIQNLRRAGTNNPVFMLDEMDKLGSSFHGDPSSALLEVLDPEQNRAFVDHYLGVPFDLSRCMFIGTANVLYHIPGPLRDRCEVIQLSSYTEEEKLEIARRYLVKRQTENNGLTRKALRISKAALREMVRHYTHEAGCRNLEREIGAVARHVATRVATGEVESVKIGVDEIHEILGARRYEREIAQRTTVAGVATGLAWTPVGGDLLFVEATAMPGRGSMQLTGQLGDVMRESAQAAMSLVRSRSDELGIDAERLRKSDVHVHIPSGAIPKDGPSAGVALYAALVSLLVRRRVKSSVAMTGEISLRGLVLPVGGIKEKVLAAYRGGIRTVLLPRRNEKDLEDVPESVRTKLRFVLLDDVADVLEHALEGGRAAGVRSRKKGGKARRASEDGRNERSDRAAREARP